MSDPLVLTRPLGGSPLARAALAGSAPGGWYRRRPRDASQWRAHGEEVRADFAHHDWLKALEPALTPSGAARERLDRVSGGRGIVVTTGQQPGLFGGPIYTWSKALSAIALADAVEESTGIPCAPIFWAATYDADYAEASASYVIQNGAVERLQMGPTPLPGRAMRDTPLGDLHPLAGALERSAGAAVDRGTIELLRAAYAPGETVGSAFVALLRGVLEPLGMAVLDAGHPAVLQTERPLLERALAESAAVDAALRRREGEMRALGHQPQVAHVEGLSLVFETVQGERRRIPIAAAAGNDARREIEPNVLLRPVAERAILPTVAYVAGPSEIAYFAQTSAAAEALGAAMPLVVGRWSGVIVEPHVRRILARCELEIDDLRDPHAALTRLVRERLSDDVRRALAGYRAALDEAAAGFARAVARTDPPLLPEAVAAGARVAIEHRIDRLERRVVAAEKRRQEALVRDVETARASLYPLGRAQERILNLVPMMARHGPALLLAMLARAREHAASLVGGEGEGPVEPAAAHDHASDSR